MSISYEKEIKTSLNVLGAACSSIFPLIGAAKGVAKATEGFFIVALSSPEGVMKCIVHLLLPSIVAIYGLLTTIVISNKIKETKTINDAILAFGAGAIVGFVNYSTGLALGAMADVGLRGLEKNKKLFTTTILVLVLGEIIGLYSLIIAFVLMQKKE